MKNDLADKNGICVSCNCKILNNSSHNSCINSFFNVHGKAEEIINNAKSLYFPVFSDEDVKTMQSIHASSTSSHTTIIKFPKSATINKKPESVNYSSVHPGTICFHEKDKYNWEVDLSACSCLGWRNDTVSYIGQKVSLEQAAKQAYFTSKRLHSYIEIDYSLDCGPNKSHIDEEDKEFLWYLYVGLPILLSCYFPNWKRLLLKDPAILALPISANKRTIFRYPITALITPGTFWMIHGLSREFCSLLGQTSVKELIKLFRKQLESLSPRNKDIKSIVRNGRMVAAARVWDRIRNVLLVLSLQTGFGNYYSTWSNPSKEGRYPRRYSLTKDKDLTGYRMSYVYLFEKFILAGGTSAFQNSFRSNWGIDLFDKNAFQIHAVSAQTFQRWLEEKFWPKTDDLIRRHFLAPKIGKLLNTRS